MSERLKIKTYMANTKEEIDNLCNEFSKQDDVDVRFVHTHILETAPPAFIYVLFYKDKSPKPYEEVYGKE